MKKMENNEENKEEKFEYTYAAPTEAERREAEEIRKHYQDPAVSEDKITRLRRLDEKAKLPPTIWALVLGVVGTIVFGAGMSIVLEKLLPYYLIVGTAVSVVGLIPIVLAYPVYKLVSKKCKAKYAEEILRLSEEILNENKDEK